VNTRKNRYRWMDNVKIDFGEIGSGVVWTGLDSPRIGTNGEL
jgi:hypothetical protein